MNRYEGVFLKLCYLYLDMKNIALKSKKSMSTTNTYMSENISKEKQINEIRVSDLTNN